MVPVIGAVFSASVTASNNAANGQAPEEFYFRTLSMGLLATGKTGMPRSLSEKQCSKRYASLVECKDANYSTTKSRLL